jgi:hypothetical protein
MQRSSDSIASLAGALAKAQAVLVNPEKTQVATIRLDGPDTTTRSFRYAPLSSGLDIVRKTLSQHEIATVQTTAVDQGAGIVTLTTVLAHSSGEWIASDWPVCAISETATPHRMGAALTYARRYALFTLVGIAGEDDLDAPDLMAPTVQNAGSQQPPANKNGRLNGGQLHSVPQGPRRASVASPAKPILDGEASAALRRKLLAELADIASADQAATWAHRSLPEKNRLAATDAQSVEQAFQERLLAFTVNGDVGDFSQRPTQGEQSTSSPGAPPEVPRSAARKRSQARRSKTTERIDKSTLAIPEPRRIRDRDHVRYVAKQPCLICGRQPSDPHHLRFAQSRALGRKVSDEFTVPLCRGHHREVHRCGDEAAWWSRVGIVPTVAARSLWLETHPLPAAQDKMVVKSATSVVGGEQSNSKRLTRKRGSNYETRPFSATRAP